jgi:ABC-type transport system involved in multi-copper enzyme maturation permease subunit
MVLEIIKKELKVNLISPKVLITYAVCAVLVLTAMLTGAMNYLSLRDEAVAQAAAEKDRLRAVYNFQMDFMVEGIHLYRQPDVLAVLVTGVEGDAARRGRITNYTGSSFDVSKFNSTPILAVFGMLDLSFIVKFILSLFAILFTFDAISGEKELGTLKMNLANPIKRGTYIIGKLIGNFILLLLPFVLPLLLGLLIVELIPGIDFAGEDWIRIALISFAFALYLLVFYSMGMMISALTKRPVVSFLILLMLWVLFISVVPRVAVLAAQTFEPVPPLDEVRKEYISEFGSTQQEFMHSVKNRVEELFEFIRSAIRTPDGMRNYQQKQQEMLTGIQEAHDEFARKMQERGAQISREQDLKQERQNRLAINLSRFTSPTAALTFAVDALAKTGVYSLNERFRDNVDNMIKGYVDYANAILRKHPELLGGGQGISTEEMDVSDAYPDQSVFTSESLSESIASSIWDFAILALAALIFLAVGVVAFLRYDVR